MIIRRARPGDSAAISVVHTMAFSGADGAAVPEARLVSALRDDGDVIAALSLVATIDQKVVGHVLCSRARIDDRRALGLAPLGVLPAYQRSGVGHALMHAVLAAADALDEPAVGLLGDPGYYRRFGFVVAHTVGVRPPDPAWIDHFQLRPLSAWNESWQGTFHYARAFDRL